MPEDPRYAAVSWDEREALGLCECGQRLDDHDPLPKPLPWSYGRPCSRSTIELGRAWDGRPAFEHTPKNRSRYTALGRSDP